MTIRVVTHAAGWGAVVPVQVPLASTTSHPLEGFPAVSSGYDPAPTQKVAEGHDTATSTDPVVLAFDGSGAAWADQVVPDSVATNPFSLSLVFR